MSGSERPPHPSMRASQDRELAEQIREVHQQSRGTYGTPRLQAFSSRAGTPPPPQANRSHPARTGTLLRLPEAALPATHHRQQSCRTDCAESPGRAAAGHPTRSIRSGESDITYIPTEQGWLYLAVIMDLYSRRLIGWAFAHHLGTELVAAALAMALVDRQPPQGLVHHCDRGVQYASAAYRQLLEGAGRPGQHESQALLL